jgi:hypothetical protein
MLLFGEGEHAKTHSHFNLRGNQLFYLDEKPEFLLHQFVLFAFPEAEISIASIS